MTLEQLLQQYKINEEGIVISKPRVDFFHHKRKSKVLQPHLSETGYSQFYAYHNTLKQLWRVHKLVALLYLPNPDGKTEVIHKDGNKQNNHVSNLEWV